jgi:beta-galactosidase
MIGVAYYPEQWVTARWKSDFGKMRSIGINTVRMGEFAWSQFEPSKGQFEFEWMDRAKFPLKWKLLHAKPIPKFFTFLSL